LAYFCPRHTGVKGNDRADWLAGTAVISDDRVMDHADVLHVLPRGRKMGDSLGDFESITMESLRDSQVVLGAG
jgi:hypothetical protein